MTTAPTAIAPELTQELARALSDAPEGAALPGGAPCGAPAAAWNVEEIRAALDYHGIAGAFHARVQEGSLAPARARGGRGGRSASRWPEELVTELAPEARRAARAELARREEIRAVLALLQREGAEPVLLFDTAHAYQVYAAPSARPRTALEIWVRPDRWEEGRAALESEGYVPLPGDATGGAPGGRSDGLSLDLNLRLLSQLDPREVFSRILSHEECSAAAARLPVLGRAARGPGPAHALLLACVQPVMAGADLGRLLWLYDVHRHARRLEDRDWAEFARLASARQVRKICAVALRRAQKYFATPQPVGLVLEWFCDESLEDEPSALFLARDRRWYHEALADLRSLPTWRERLKKVVPYFLSGAASLSRS